MKILANLLGDLIRDTIISIEGYPTEYKLKDGKLIYSYKLPFTISIGGYKFVPKKKFKTA